jgi:hypothetical protein
VGTPPEGEDGKPGPWKRPALPFERGPEGGSRAPGTSAGRWAAAGFEFAVAVVLFFLGGMALDAKLGSGPWLSLAGSVVGIAVGTYLLIRPALRAMSRPPANPDGSPREGTSDEGDGRSGGRRRS